MADCASQLMAGLRIRGFVLAESVMVALAVMVAFAVMVVESVVLVVARLAVDSG